MGESRTCDARCHFAEQDKCDCWCGGLFHGRKGSAARQAFREAYDEPIPSHGEPPQGDLFRGADRWKKAIQAAQSARKAVRR